MPVFLGAARSRKQLQVVASGSVPWELELHTGWAVGVAMMPEDEVLVRVIDYALTEFLRSDKKWQREGRIRGGRDRPQQSGGRSAGGQGDGAGRDGKTDPNASPGRRCHHAQLWRSRS
jgi:hypothetical protein